MPNKGWILGLALAAVAVPGRSHAEVSEATFQVRTTGDLVDLCTASPSDPMFTAALNFCQGFGVGVFRVLQEQEMARRSRHLFCVPNPGPSRNQAFASFTAWARANPAQLAQPPQDGIAAFLATQYPCPAGR